MRILKKSLEYLCVLMGAYVLYALAAPAASRLTKNCSGSEALACLERESHLREALSKCETTLSKMGISKPKFDPNKPFQRVE